MEQPDKFSDAENWWDLEKYIEAAYQDDGWYIENIEIVDNYYTENKEDKLLNLK